MTPVEQQRSLSSSNPILSRPQFRRRGGQKTAAKDPRAGIAVARSGAGPGKELDRHPDDFAPLPFVVADLMTMDDVLNRAGAGLAVTVTAAALSWAFLPHASLSTLGDYGVAVGAGLLAAALVIVQYRRNLPSPLCTLTFAALQGVFLGVLSMTVSSHLSPGVFVQMVLGTMTTCAGVLLAHKLHWVRANRRFWPYVGASLLGLCLLALADWCLYPVMGADNLGLRPAGLGVFAGVVGVLLSGFLLSLHVRKAEDGITCGALRAQSWTAAFGLTLSLVWLYVETVRLFTLFPGEELY
ncbi:Bax inhibitor-1/YccA family protein [Streptomyces sp. NPDC093516]|uniref:Bax inhibitor-1/YccA family membrane protein n=1 Tax=Streptomyces sp. NPDC093516 TaxID=3155304 RepID=UPI00341B00B3